MSNKKENAGRSIWMDKEQESGSLPVMSGNQGESISVIVPVFNGEKYLENCIESILQQTFTELEIIIINDGSTDGTAKICQALEEQHENITVIHMNDEGVSAARNAGLKTAKGKYITFVDADDRLFSEMLERLYKAIREIDCDVAGCGFATWSREEDWQELCVQMQKEAKTCTNGQEEICHICTGKDFWQQGIYGGNTRCWSKLYKRSVIGNTAFREGLTIGEDMLFLADLLPKAGKLVTIPYKGYGYYQNPSGAMLRKFTPRYMDQITCWEIARRKVLDEAPHLKDKAGSVIMVSVMLTVGKIALLSGKERRQVKEYIEECHEKLKEEMKSRTAFAMLDGGYRIKTRLFRAVPGVYLWFYHLKKYKAG